MTDTYVCERCGETFNKVITDEEAQAEYRQLVDAGAYPDDNDTATVCHECFQAFSAWMKLQGLVP